MLCSRAQMGATIAARGTVEPCKRKGRDVADVDRSGRKMVTPQRDAFFRPHRRGAASRGQEISALLVECCARRQPTPSERRSLRGIHQVEHEADRVIAEMYEALNRTFVTPLDRSDIFALAVSSSEARRRRVRHRLAGRGARDGRSSSCAEPCELAALVLQAADEPFRLAVVDLRDMKNSAGIREAVRVAQPPGEREGDRSIVRSPPRCSAQRPTPSG